jgi:zinc transport system substrate-binding protein
MTRRSVLAGAGGAAAGLAGCLGQASEDDDDGQTVAVSSFFTFFDFARKVADGTAISVNNLVPTGLHGHGWEPDPSITRDIIDADAFLHVGSDFQPWADRAINTIDDEDADTDLINVRDGVDLIPLADTLTEEEEVEGGMDPHFWLDPQRAKQSVDNIADGFAAIAPDEESALTDNATRVKSELDAVDAEWQTIFDEAERDVVFLAAHNAFEYLSRRYDATIQPLVTNLAANNDVRPTDRAKAQDTIEEYDIRYIGAAVFEPLRPAQQLVADTDVEAYYPVTPYAGTTQEWADKGWGYFEIARQINMNTFKIVLDSGEPDSDFVTEWENFE